MFMPLKCSMDISIEAWLQLFSGVAAVIVAIMAIIHGNRNSRKAIQQQNRILEYQNNEKKLDECRKCLSDNMDLLNEVEIFSPLVSMNHTDYSRTKHEIASRKSMIYTCDMRFRYLFESVDVTPLIVEYRKHWNLGTSQLTLVLDTMMEYVNYLSEFASNIEISKNLRQQISLYERMSEVDSNNSSSYLNEITKLQKEQSQLKEFLSHNKERVDMYMTSIQSRLDDLRIHTIDLHQLTMKVIAEKEKQVNLYLNHKYC